ncbi:MAG: uroporphyrinogen-III synthase, partial [Rhizomicrobium sp.]
MLVTRPAGDGEATAEKLKALGHDPILAPLIDIQFRDGGEIALDGVQAILATSANGVRAIARRTPRRDVALFAVGRQTAAAARAARFARVRSADGDG